MKYLAGLFLASLCGCSSSSVPPQRAAEVSAEIPKAVSLHDALTLLDAEARKRRLRYEIFCTSNFQDVTGEEYEAIAEHIEAPFNAIYYEDGRLDEWMETGRTQAEAALALYNSIQGAPTHPAIEKKRPKTPMERGIQCKPPIKGNWKLEPAR